MKNLTGIYWIKNEARYLPEYMEFHMLQGFDHFIFYDNGSTDDLLSVVAPYIEEGVCEIRTYPELGNQSKNFWVMHHCIQEQRGKTKWLHFHAVDERLFCPNGQNLVEFLKDYEQYGGVAVAWLFFNSNGHDRRPEGLMIDNFTEAFGDDWYHIKTVIQPEKAIAPNGNPHCFSYRDGFYAVTENHKRQDGPFVKSPTNGRFEPGEDYTYNKIKLHHYLTLSKEEAEEKANKGLLDHGSHSENRRRIDADEGWIRNHSDRYQYFQDNSLSKYSEQIKENLRKRYEGREHLMHKFNH